MKRNRLDIAVAGTLFVVLTALGFIAYNSVSVQPEGASREAEIIDGAFDLLMYLSIPVFAFVVAVLGYTVIRFRSTKGDDEDARPLRTDARFVWPWIVITASLAIFSIFNPGLKGLAELNAEPNAELTINVVGQQWNWEYEYEELGFTLTNSAELVLPLDTRIAFNITSTDVLHAFWIPALRIKADAVPGSVATILTTPTSLGSFDADPTMRVQCAEICGTGHSRMRASARVVDEDEFSTWVVENGGTP